MIIVPFTFCWVPFHLLSSPPTQPDLHLESFLFLGTYLAHSCVQRLPCPLTPYPTAVLFDGRTLFPMLQGLRPNNKPVESLLAMVSMRTVDFGLPLLLSYIETHQWSELLED